MRIDAFQPSGNVKATVTTSSQAVELSGTGRGANVLVTNASDVNIFVAFGGSTVIVTVSGSALGTIVLSKQAILFGASDSNTHSHIAVKGESAPGSADKAYFTTGNGS